MSCLRRLCTGRQRIRLTATYTTQHEADTIQMIRQSVSKFVDQEITPFVNEWEDAGIFPRELYRKAGDAGILSVGLAEPYGIGTDMHKDPRFMLALCDELCRSGSGGIVHGLLSLSVMYGCTRSHFISVPPILAVASDEMKARVVPRIVAGDAISALAVTEPGGGSDVANLSTTARRDGDDYIVSGSKCFITSGVRADYLTTAVRTGGGGAKGVSLLLIEGDMEGVSRHPMVKMGWHCSDTAMIRFEDVRVPRANLIGEENQVGKLSLGEGGSGSLLLRGNAAPSNACTQGFRGIMTNFNNERIMLAQNCVSLAKVCHEEALDWAQSRSAFGATLSDFQVLSVSFGLGRHANRHRARQAVRHKLVDMQMQIEAASAYIDRLSLDQIALSDATDTSSSAYRAHVASVCMVKNFASKIFERVASDAVQILGGAGYMRGMASERLFRETKVMQIGGGSIEVMKDLAAKQLKI